MQFLNIVFFIILVFFMGLFLLTDGRIVKNPLDRSQKVLLTGPEMYWVVVFSTGLLAFSYDLGIDLMAIRLLIIMVLCCVGFGIVKDSPILSKPLIIYLVYLAWLFVGCFYTLSVPFGIRTMLKYAFPLIFCLFASAAIDNFVTAIKSAIAARWVAVACVIITFIPFLYTLFDNVIWYITARVIHFISMMVFSLAMFFFTKEKKLNLFLFILFLLPCFVLLLRTSILGSVAAIVAFSFIRWKLKSLPVILGVVILGVISVFAIPSLRNKMFFDNKTSIEEFRAGKIDMSDVNTNYRAYMWDRLENNLYRDHELLGSGTGSTQYFMQANPRMFANLAASHSDFVQMRCDNGIIGLVIYSAMIAAIYIHCFLIYWRTGDNRIKLFALTAGASLIGVFATFYSDNTVNYSLATLSIPFGFYGMTLALNKRLR